MNGALRMYGDGLLDALSTGVEHHVRLSDGTSLPLSLERWLGPADATDEELLDGLTGPVLDVGCGPGRHLRALAARGVFALGVDISPVAVELAVGRGARAIVGDIFSELPGSGTWVSALLLDGNIGIGGSPIRLLARIATLLTAGGEVLVEIESPRGCTGATVVRIERAGHASPWFAWARVAAPGIDAIARASGFTPTETWTRSGRWFARLRRDDSHGPARNPPPSVRYVEFVPVLQARGVTKSVGRGRAQRQVLRDAQLDVDTGEVVAVLGRSGSGKSTLLHLLGGLDRPDAGEILLAVGWPAFRAAGQSPMALLQGAGLRATRRERAGHLGGAGQAGLATLGARLVSARRGRLAVTVATLGISAGFVLLLLALASALSALETDPGALGKRYELTAADSFALGETLDVIAYPGDHTRFEAPPLTAGRRLAGAREAEVGAGLGDALGLSPGSTLAIALPSGRELRLRVAGIVSSLDDDGRVAYVPAAALLGADPGAPEALAIRLSPGTDPTPVNRALRALGAVPAAATGATGRGVPLVKTLRAILEAVAVIDGLVCLYALAQTCTLTVQERRRTIAVLRATGAGSAAIRRLLTGVVLVLVLPAAVLGVLLERTLLGPSLSHLAENYATLELNAGSTQIATVLVGLLLTGAAAVLVVTRRTTRETVVEGLTGP